MIASYTPGRQPEPEEIATPEQRSNRACLQWRFERDLAPLAKVLKASEANAAAQALAAELLMAATKKKLPDTKKDQFRTAAILSQWAMAQGMGTPPEKAKAAAAEMFDISVKMVEKLMRQNPELVAQLRKELKL